MRALDFHATSVVQIKTSAQNRPFTVGPSAQNHRRVDQGSVHLSSFDAATDNQILKSGLRGGVQTAAPRATLQAVNTVKSTAHGVSATEPDQKPKKVRAKRRPKSGYGRACAAVFRCGGLGGPRPASQTATNTPA